MAVDGGHRDGACDWDGRWNHVRKFLERPGPFTHPDFEPSTEVSVNEEGSILVKCWTEHGYIIVIFFSFLKITVCFFNAVLQTFWCFYSSQSLQFLLETCKILVIGAGGLGCELLKNLVGDIFSLHHIVVLNQFQQCKLSKHKLPLDKYVSYSYCALGPVRVSSYSCGWHGHYWCVQPQQAVSVQVGFTSIFPPYSCLIFDKYSICEKQFY